MQFGTIDDKDKSLQSGESSFKFGLNKVRLTKFVFNPNYTTKNGTSTVIEVVFKAGDSDSNIILFDQTGQDIYAGNSKISPNEDGYDEAFEKQAHQLMGTVVHLLKATGVSQLQINQKFQQPKNSLSEWMEAAVQLVPQNAGTKDIDLFMEYQWAIGKKADRTYLTVPKNMKGGYFVCPSVTPVGKWVPVNLEEEEIDYSTVNLPEGVSLEEVQKAGLKYIDEASNIHPLMKSVNYMGSNKAIQQFKKKDEQDYGGANVNQANNKNLTWD